MDRDDDYLFHGGAQQLLQTLRYNSEEPLHRTYYIDKEAPNGDTVTFSFPGVLVAKIARFDTISNVYKKLQGNNANIKHQVSIDLADCLNDAVQ